MGGSEEAISDLVIAGWNYFQIERTVGLRLNLGPRMTNQKKFSSSNNLC